MITSDDFSFLFAPSRFLFTPPTDHCSTDTLNPLSRKFSFRFLLCYNPRTSLHKRDNTWTTQTDLTVGTIRKIDIEHEMQTAYLFIRHERHRLARHPDAARWFNLCSAASSRHARHGLAPDTAYKNRRASSAKCWANIIRTATPPCTTRWRAWRKIFLCAACW